MGYDASIISATRYATPEETAGTLFASASSYDVLCMGGETKLKIPDGVEGIGGRNTHLALFMLSAIKENQAFISLASDGRDNGSAAGAIVDASSLHKAAERELVLQQYLTQCDSYSFFEKIGDLIFTGPLESNVADLMVFISPRNSEV
jgi:hydroxypyruvate reductase